MTRPRARDLVGALTVGLLLAACPAGSSNSGPSAAAPTSSGAPIGSTSSTTSASPAGGPAQVDIGGREIYLDCRGTGTAGEPTIILVSGYHDSSDVWNQSDVLSLVGSAVGPPVQEALAASHRVCSYDRPGTLRYVEGLPLTDRSTPVTQPRTVQDIVQELHAVLASAAVPGPYLLVGHSLGGLIVRLYGQTYPDQVEGIVFVDGFSPTVPLVFGPEQWAIYRDQLLNAPPESAPLDSLRSPDSERVDLDASAAQALAAPALPVMPLAVLTKTESFGGLTSLPGLPAEVTNALYEQAQDDFIALSPDTPQFVATGSDHYIQFSQPDLVVTATELVLGRIQG